MGLAREVCQCSSTAGPQQQRSPRQLISSTAAARASVGGMHAVAASGSGDVSVAGLALARCVETWTLLSSCNITAGVLSSSALDAATQPAAASDPPSDQPRRATRSGAQCLLSYIRYCSSTIFLAEWKLPTVPAMQQAARQPASRSAAVCKRGGWSHQG